MLTIFFSCWVKARRNHEISGYGKSRFGFGVNFEYRFGSRGTRKNQIKGGRDELNHLRVRGQTGFDESAGS